MNSIRESLVPVLEKKRGLVERAWMLRLDRLGFKSHLYHLAKDRSLKKISSDRDEATYNQNGILFPLSVHTNNIPQPVLQSEEGLCNCVLANELLMGVM